MVPLRALLLLATFALLPSPSAAHSGGSGARGPPSDPLSRIVEPYATGRRGGVSVMVTRYPLWVDGGPPDGWPMRHADRRPDTTPLPR